MPNPSNATHALPPSPLITPNCSFAGSAMLAIALLAATCVSPAHAQSPTAAPTPAPPVAPTAFSIGSLRPALANLQTAIGQLNVPHWKVPSAIRGNVQQDVSSMQRDLTATLPGLMSDAEASAPTGPAALSPSFAVYRNLDALYDVLLRVTETAALANAEADATALESARAGLEEGRARLGVWLSQSIAAQDARLVQAQAPATHAAAPATPAKVVVTDGPEGTKPRKKKPVSTPQ